jgi:hypothetical protein
MIVIIMRSSSTHKQVVSQHIEAFNQGDLELLQRLLPPDALLQGVLGWGGLDKAIPMWKELREAFAIESRKPSLIYGR